VLHRVEELFLRYGELLRGSFLGRCAGHRGDDQAEDCESHSVVLAESD